MKYLIGVLTIVSFLLILGCGSSKDQSSTKDNSGGTNNSDVIVDTSSDGSADLIEDNAPEGQTAQSCKTDDDCKSLGDNYYCNCHNKCIQGECSVNENCGSDKYCDPCDKKCHDRGDVCSPCEEDYQCQEDMVCVKNVLKEPFCAMKCVPHGACVQPNKYDCVDIGLKDAWGCVPKTKSCTTTEECKKDSDCPFGKICHPQTHRCISAQCDKDNECPQGRVCEMGRCIDACNTAADCEKNQKPDWAAGRPWICEEGHCKIKGACFRPYDCPEPETYCDGTTHQCKPGCQIDYDCKDAAKTCVNGHCIDKGCEHNFDCDLGQICDKATGKCKDAPNIYCMECHPDKQGQNLAGDCPDPNAICLTLKDKDGNEKGSYCFPPCQGDPKDVDACPQGYQCAEITITKQGAGGQQTQTKKHNCVRSCYVGNNSGSGNGSGNNGSGQ